MMFSAPKLFCVWLLFSRTFLGTGGANTKASWDPYRVRVNGSDMNAYKLYSSTTYVIFNNHFTY